MIGLMLCMASCTYPMADSTLRIILLEQLRNTHTQQDWFVPTNEALAGLTIEQVTWKDNKQNHSILELVSHLAFWNERILTAFEGGVVPDFNDNNEITFMTYKEGDWKHALEKLDRLQTAWEIALNDSTEKQLEKWSSSIANICSHNAYHTGQIIYIRKMHGWWK